MRVTPRMRLCRFSSVRSAGRSPNDGANMSRRATWAGSMAMVRKSMPRFSANACASEREWSLEKRDGMDTPCTWSAPMASTATTATSVESMPPDRPITTSVNPFFTR